MGEMGSVERRGEDFWKLPWGVGDRTCCKSYREDLRVRLLQHPLLRGFARHRPCPLEFCSAAWRRVLPLCLGAPAWRRRIVSRGGSGLRAQVNSVCTRLSSPSAAGRYLKHIMEVHKEKGYGCSICHGVSP